MIYRELRGIFNITSYL